MAHATGIEKAGKPAYYFAACTECHWTGPVRQTWDEAQADQDGHILATDLTPPSR